MSVYSILDMQPRTLVTHAMLDENFSKLILTVICAARSVPLSPCGLKKKMLLGILRFYVQEGELCGVKRVASQM